MKPIKYLNFGLVPWSHIISWSMAFNFVFFLRFDAFTQAPNPASDRSHFLRLNEINPRAVRHFLDHFPAATETRWTESNDYYIAIFKIGDLLNRVYYTTNGFFAYAIRYYESALMDKNVKQQILKRFPAGDIRMVTEVSNGSNKPVYFIELKDGQGIRTIRYQDGYLETVDNSQPINW